MLTHTIITERRKIRRWYGETEEVATTTFTLGPTPYRIYSRWELPENYELEDYESEDDSWIKRDKQFYNLKDFCKIGCPHLPGPYGGAQCAVGDFLIASYRGEVYPVSVREIRPIWR